MCAVKTRRAIKIAPMDTVAVALEGVSPGEVVAVDGARLEARDPIPRGHKIALTGIEAGADVIKYGAPIGRTLCPVAPGAHVHTHNLVTRLEGEERYVLARQSPPARTPDEDAWFDGYRRADGRVGVRNEIWIVATVGCVARTCEEIARQAQARWPGRVDRVVALTHPFGCSQLGDDLNGTRAVLAALAQHPNAGGVLFVGLGCESNKLEPLLAAAPALDPARVRSLSAQRADDEIEEGLAHVDSLMGEAGGDVRTRCPASDLVIGLKCGGSDGFSGITANPLVGRIADRVTRLGGTAILTEIPEIFGAERLLMARAKDEAVFERLVALVNDFKRYFIAHGQPVYENPSPGNIEGGITTLEEKSLGAVQKGGAQTIVADVLRYGERVREKGLSILEAPGNDAVSSTALTAAGAQIILFTTGRGTPLGFPAPTMKIASNRELAEKKPRWIDFDASAMLDGETDARDAEAALFERILATASGALTKSEESGDRAISIWKRGVTL